MTPIEREALDFICRMQQELWEEQKTERFLQAFDRESTWIAGRRQGRGGPALLECRGEAGDTVLGQEYSTCPLAEDSCLVYGWTAIQPLEGGPASKRLVTAVCVKTPRGMRLAHWHCSGPDEEEQEERARELEALAANIPGGVYSCLNDEGYALTSMSTGFLRLLGYTRQEINQQFGGSFEALMHPGDRQAVRQEINRQLAAGFTTVESKYRVLCKGGGAVWVLDKSRLVLDEQGNESFYAVIMDITQRERVQEELALSLERHQVIMDQTTDIIFEWDIRKDILEVSHNWEKKFGYKAVSKDATQQIAQSEHVFGPDLCAFWELQRQASMGEPYNEAEFRISDSTGCFIWCRIRATTQFDQKGEPIKVIGVIVDIDAEKKREEELLRRAHNDALTGLLNKEAVRQRVEGILARAPQGSHALMIVDMDHFKLVNDTCGHLYGDAVLCDAADTLKKLFRATDVLGRIGGDEFLVFLANIQGREAVEGKARQVLQRIEQGLHKEDLPEGVGCSVGVALSAAGASDYLSLYRQADQALYRAKASGRHQFAVYEDAMDRPGALADAGSEVGSRIESGQKEESRALGQYIFRMLYEAVDVPAAINRLLGIIGRTHDVSRVYIFEDSPDGKRCSNTFEWCNDGVEPQMDYLQDRDYLEFGDYPSHFNEEGIFYLHDVENLNPELRDFLAGQGVAAMLQCLIRDGGESRGFVGFDECRSNRKWTQEQVDSLTTAANVLSTFLMKHRLKERLEKTEEPV